jgi:hypothetical protein
VAIARAVEEAIGKRRGQRTDRGELPVPGQEVESDKNGSKPSQGQETREFAAKQAGFGSEASYRRAAAVVENGVPELVEAMDAGAIPVKAAAEVAAAVRKGTARLQRVRGCDGGCKNGKSCRSTRRRGRRNPPELQRPDEA